MKNIEQLEKEIKELIDKELSLCSKGFYPNLCELRDSSLGKEKVYSLALKAISETGMSVKSALSFIESSL